MRNLSSKFEKQSHVSQQPVRHLTSLNPRLPSMHASATHHLGLLATLASSVRLTMHMNLEAEDVEETFLQKMHTNPGLLLAVSGVRASWN